MQVADPFATLVNHYVSQGFNREEVALALAAQKGRLEGQDTQVSRSEPSRSTTTELYQ